MSFIKLDLSRFKNACLVRTNVLTCTFKILLFIAICQTLKQFFNLKDFWIIPIWFALTVLIDGFLILKTSKLFDKMDFNEEEQQKYALNSQEFIRYLNFFPKIRLGRTLLATTFTLMLFKPLDWATAFLAVNFLGFILLDPLLKHIFNVKAPLIFQNSGYCQPYKLMESKHDLHRNDAGWPGSAAWTAVRSARQFDNYPHL